MIYLQQTQKQQHIAITTKEWYKMTDSELLQAIYKDTQELKQRMSNVENKVTHIELMIENEIDMQRIDEEMKSVLRSNV